MTIFSFKKCVLLFLDLLDESQTKLSSDLLEARRNLSHIEVCINFCVFLPVTLIQLQSYKVVVQNRYSSRFKIFAKFKTVLLISV